MSDYCYHCKVLFPVDVPDGWQVAALCPSCVDANRIRDEKRADAARRFFGGDESAAQEYLELLREGI